MNFEAVDGLDIDEIEVSVADLDPKGKITALFSIRSKLLHSARESTCCREVIFDGRKRLAAIFRQHGGDRHNESAQIFEGLIQPDDILKHAAGIKQKPRQAREETRQRPFAFYVYGPGLNDQGVANMRKFLGAKGRRLGSMNQLDPLGLLHVLEETYDGRPIYITQALDENEKLCRQLVVVAKINPRLAKRLFTLEWNDDVPNPKPITEDSSFQRFSASLVHEDGKMEALSEFIYHQPGVGEMFNGRITRAVESGFFVEIIPGVSGLAHKSKIPSDLIDTLKEGDAITVVVTEIMGADYIRLSMTQAKEEADRGKQPLFEGNNLRLLASAVSGEDIS